MKDIELKQISVFMAVRELGGLTAAQERLGMSCSAISKTLADLEIRVGTKLCHRGRSGFQITNEGERFYDSAVRLHVSFSQFKLDVSGLKKRQLLQFNIGVVDSTLNDKNNPLPARLIAMQEKYSNLEFRIQVTDSYIIADKLLADEFDVGLTFQSSVRPPLLSKEIYREDLVFICGHYHKNRLSNLMAKGASVEQLRTLLNEYGLVSFKSVFDLYTLDPHLFADFDALEQIDNIEALIWQVSTGRRFGLIPIQTFDVFQHCTGICQVTTKEPLTSSMYLVYKPAKKQKKDKQEMINLLLDG